MTTPTTTPDFKRADEAAEFYCGLEKAGVAEFNPVFNLAEAYQATREREARLEAAVRELGKCRYSTHYDSTHCNGGRLKYTIGGRDPERRDEPCPNCGGTGLVKEARKVLLP